MKIKDIHKMTVGEFADLCNVTPQTIRWYDKNGIVHPSYVSETGYRYYDIIQCTYVYSTKQLQSMGFSLEQVKNLLEKKTDYRDVVTSMREKLDETTREIRILEQKKSILKRSIENYSLYGNMPPAETVMHEWRPEKEILLFDAGVIKSEYDFLEGRKEFFEFLYRWNPDYTYCNIGFLTKRENLERVVHQDYLDSDYLFIEKEPWNAQCGLPVHKMPGGVYLSVYTHTYTDDSPVGLNMLKYARENGYRIIGDLIGENFWDLSMPFTDVESYFMEVMRVPVTFRGAEETD